MNRRPTERQQQTHSLRQNSAYFQCQRGYAEVTLSNWHGVEIQLSSFPNSPFVCDKQPVNGYVYYCTVWNPTSTTPSATGLKQKTHAGPKKKNLCNSFYLHVSFRLFYQYLYKIFNSVASNLSSSCCSYVPSLLTNLEQKKRLARDVVDTLATHAGLAYDVTDWMQNGSTHGRVFWGVKINTRV